MGKAYGGWQAEAYSIEYGWKNTSIVIPANVYGPVHNSIPIMPWLSRLSSVEPLKERTHSQFGVTVHPFAILFMPRMSRMG